MPNDGKAVSGNNNPAFPSGFVLDPKKSELRNVRCIGIDAGSHLMFVKSNDADNIIALQKAWKSIRQFDEDYTELERFAKISSVADAESYAIKHGPLFGGFFDSGGIVREPVSMWFFASTLFNLGMKLKAAFDSGDWARLQNDSVAFEFELCQLSAKQKRDRDVKRPLTIKPNQPFIASACSRFAATTDRYFEFALGRGVFEKGGFFFQKWDDPAVERKILTTKPVPWMGMFDKSPEDRLQTAIENSFPSLHVAITTLKDLELFLPADVDTVRLDLEAIGVESRELGRKLCRLMSEALISIHCMNMHFDWVGHEFRPVFYERIRYLWYLYSIYKDNKVMDFCQRCGRPFFKSRADRKYCGDTCRLAANRRKG